MDPTPEQTVQGQESVWDYPRPPAWRMESREVTVQAGDIELARSRRAVKAMETASPPTFYLPAEDVRTDMLRRAPGRTYCEWKGRAAYDDIVLPDRTEIPRAAWTYPEPNPGWECLRGHFAFYASKLDCRIDGERARAQPGDFYGGWITDDVKGPFKGEAGTLHW